MVIIYMVEATICHCTAFNNKKDSNEKRNRLIYLQNNTSKRKINRIDSNNKIPGS